MPSGEKAGRCPLRGKGSPFSAVRFAPAQSQNCGDFSLFSDAGSLNSLQPRLYGELNRQNSRSTTRDLRLGLVKSTPFTVPHRSTVTQSRRRESRDILVAARLQFLHYRISRIITISRRAAPRSITSRFPFLDKSKSQIRSPL